MTDIVNSNTVDTTEITHLNNQEEVNTNEPVSVQEAENYPATDTTETKGKKKKKKAKEEKEPVAKLTMAKMQPIISRVFIGKITRKEAAKETGKSIGYIDDILVRNFGTMREHFSQEVAQAKAVTNIINNDGFEESVRLRLLKVSHDKLLKALEQFTNPS